MTQLELAREGTITAQMKKVAEKEGVEAEFIRQGIAEGTIVIPANNRRSNLEPCGIGRGLHTKVNANIGTSDSYGDIDTELAKLKVAVEYKSDAVMDLSTGGDIVAVRRAILDSCSIPLGTVPVYQAAVASVEKHGSIVDMTADDLFSAIEQQAEDGVDFITVHCGITRRTVEQLKTHGRFTNVVSRGGAFLVGRILHQQQENPLYEQYDRLLDIARRYDITLSLGDGMRPGSLADATDCTQIEELVTLAELVERAWAAGVQVIVEGPGHVPMDQIVANVQLQKRLCKGAPFYVLGPLVTDIAAGYDHIAGAIGGAIAAAAGADFLCYVTPSEHLALPDIEDVRDGVIASRIAAHAADIVKGIKNASDWDKEMSGARKNLDWQKQEKLSLNPAKVKEAHNRFPSGDTCSMCGPYCAMALVNEYLGVPTVKCQ